MVSKNPPELLKIWQICVEQIFMLNNFVMADKEANIGARCSAYILRHLIHLRPVIVRVCDW